MRMTFSPGAFDHRLQSYSKTLSGNLKYTKLSLRSHSKSYTMIPGQQNGANEALESTQAPKLTPSEFKAYNRLADLMELFVSLGTIDSYRPSEPY